MSAIGTADSKDSTTLGRSAGAAVAWLALGAMIACTVAVGAGIWSLYRAAYAEQLNQFRGSAQLVAGFIEAVARFDARHSQGAHPAGSAGATMSQIEEGLALSKTSRPTEELIIGQIEGGRILVMRRGDSGAIERVTTVPGNGDLAQPLVRALRGEAGSAELLDYRGVPVLAGYAFVPALRIGIVHKIDLGAMRAPYLRAAAWAALFAAAIIALEAAMFVLVARRVRRQSERTERERRESNERFEKAFQASPDSITLVTLDEGRFVQVNRSFETFTGWTPGEAIGRTAVDLELWIEPAQREFVFAELRAGRTVRNLEARIRRKDGALRIGRRFATVVEVSGRPHVLSIMRDITAEKDVEERLRFLLAATGTVIYTAQASGDYRATFISDNVLAATGYAAQKFIDDPEHWLSRLHADDAPRVLAAMGELEERPRQQHEYRFRCADGSYRWMRDEMRLVRDAAGHPVEIVGSWTDITERKIADEALSQFKTTLDQTQDCVFIFAPDSLRFTYVNKGAIAQVGYTAEELLRMTPLDIKPEFDEPRFRRMIGSLLSGERPSLMFGTLHRHKDGADIPVEILLQYLAPAGQPPRFVAIVRDVTERKLAEERLHSALAEKEVLLKEIYHRVKNNLQVVSSLLAMQGSGAGAESRALLGESANRVKSMALVHEQLYRSGDLSSIAYRGYVEQLLEHLRHAHGDAARRVELRAEVEEVRLGIETAVPLGLIVNELVSNAYKHGYPDSRRGEIRLSLRALGGGELELEVADDGVGLPEGFDAAKAGTLGMQLVVSLAQQLEAKLEWGAARGARFALRFAPEEREGQRLAQPAQSLAT